jgi:catechol 2,3-dioxygenase-like lactoylglutathione lyase family enzyme
MDWKLELVAVPVSDVDASKAFYVDKVGFNEDHDHRMSDDLRFVQLTPPGSACSIAIGTGITEAAPGAAQGLQLVVDDAASDVQSYPWGDFVFFRDPDGNGWAVQAIPARD